MMIKRLHFFFFSFFFIFFVVKAQKVQSYAGHFVDREGHTDVIIRDKGDTFEVDFTKDGGYHKGQAKLKEGMLEGIFENGKIKTSFNIFMQVDHLELVSEGYHLVLNKADDYEYEAPTSYNFVQKRIAKVEIPFPTGARVYSQDGKISFNLIDENWDFSERESVFNLTKEDFQGWCRILPHEMMSLDDAKENFNITELFPGKFEQTNYENYGKCGVFRSYKGTDGDNKTLKFHLLTIVGLEGKGIHIFVGSHVNYYKKDYEVWCKMLANSVELL